MRFAALSWKARHIALSMRKQEAMFIKNSEVRNNNSAVNELIEAGYVTYHTHNEIEGVRLTQSGLKRIAEAIEKKEIDVSEYEHQE